LDEFRDKPIDVRAFERIGDRVYEMFRQQPFRLPPQMTFILKSVTTLDGIARSLDPRYNLLAASQPFVRSFVISSGSARTTGSFTERARSFLKQQFGKESKSERSWRRLEEKIRREELTFSVRSSSGERVLQRIYLAIKVLIDACLMGFCLLAAIALLSTSYRHLAIVLFSLTGLFGLLFLRSSIGLSIRERVDRMAENSGSPPPATAPERER
jgi:predicted unusual protein kinase regulating ubiquinone biosynthesis (AarF/ABC1/UbiB family)